MKALKMTAQQMEQALSIVNQKYDGNVEFKRFDPTSRSVSFTFKVKSSKGPGHRESLNAVPYGGHPRRMVSACWHVHGDLFDAILSINPAAVIRSLDLKIYKDAYGQVQGNWQDRNIGSQMYPVMHSTACECNGEVR